MRVPKQTNVYLLALVCFYAALYLDRVEAARVRGTGRTAERNERTIEVAVDPWTLNEAVCPPVLCGPEPGPVGGGEQRHPTNTSSSQGPIMAEPLRSRKKSPSSAFPFFEGDIVLDKIMSKRLARAKARAARTRARESRERSLDNTRSRSSRTRSRGRSSRSRDEVRSRGKRSIVRPVTRLWQYGIIPYIIDQRLPDKTKYYIERSMKHIENLTCITFRWRNETTDHDYLYFINQPGCWSYVGRRGGEQYVSLGRGCSYFGTALHEMTHAIGFWHEQSRLDRDEYVKVMTANLPPSAVDQFGVRQTSESTSRGFAYDYGSIMHYGTHYFSSNSKATLKVIGIGKELGLKIGQRKGLSDLDVAQLRDMYHCNDKDAEQRACKKGWKKNGKSCYLFVTSPRQQYGKAESECRAQGGHLVSLETQEEDNYIKTTLITSYTNHTKWRTGGRLWGSKWMWFNSNSRHQTPFTHTSWAPSHPGRYSTLLLVRYDGTPPRFVWRGAWAGSESQLPKYAHSYICEMPAKTECVVSRRNGRNYRGTLSYTRQGTQCQKWTSQYPHSHIYLRGSRKTLDEARHGLGDHNYCRNPDSPKRKRPWCFTNLTEKRWQYCDIKVTDQTCDSSPVTGQQARN